MAEVDNKVVSITFDNASFERKMNETIASLDRLRASLDLAGAKKGLTELSETGNKFNLDTMNTSIEGTSAKFIAMTTVGIQALTALVGGAARAGVQFAKSLAIEPITQGFGEFELKMGSIQTIMAGSGESLDVVNQKLNELNKYSDRTIYSFGDMTSNIGKFTNAGVKLDDAVGAIQGVANVAALSGANAEEASRAMYNFGQALGQGSVKAIDWKSIELANMGTVEFKQQLIDAAVAMGTLKKAGDGTFKTLEGTTVTTGNFATTLQDAWLSSDVLTTTLNKFSDTSTDIGKRASDAATKVKTFSQMLGTMKESVGSSWAQTFETVVGNFDEGSELFTNINNVFSGIVGKSADARNHMLQQWKNLGGRDQLLKGFWVALHGIGTIIKPIKEAFRDIFPKKSGKDLLELTKRFAEFASKIQIGSETAEKVKVAFRGFFAILDIGWEILKNVARLFFTLASGVWKVVGPILGLVSGTGELATGLHAVLVKGQGIDKFFDAIIYVLNNFFTAVGDVVTGFVELVRGLDLFGKAADALEAPIEMLQKAAGAIKDFFANLKFGDKAGSGVKKTGEAVEETANLVDRLFAALKNVFGQIGNLLAGVGRGIAGAFKGLGGAIANAMGSGDFGQVLDVLKVGLLGGILVYIKKFFDRGLLDFFKKSSIFGKIGEMLDNLNGSLKAFQQNLKADTLVKIATAVGILAVSMIALSLVDGEALAKALAAMTAGFAQLGIMMKVLDTMSSGGGALKITAMAGGMVLMAAAMALLVIPIMALSTMDMMDLAKGLLGVGVGMAGMAIAMRIMGESQNLSGVFKASAAMILVSVALIVLAKAIKAFAEMNLGEVGFGLAQAALGVGLLIMALKRMPDDVAAKGLGLLILAFALRSLARVVDLFAGMETSVLAKGFIAIAGGLFLIGRAMDAFPDDMIQKSLSLIALSGAMYIMGMAIEKVGSLDFGTILKGVGALVVMLTLLTAAILVMSEAEGGVAGMLAAAAGLYIMGMAIEKVGSIPFGELIKGIVGLALVLAVLAAASYVAGQILLLGGALAAVGAAFVLFGIGISLAGKGFELMAKFGGQAMGHLTEALQEFIRQLPQFVSAFVEGLIQAAVEIGDALPKLVKTIENLFTSILDAFLNVLPKVRQVVTEVLTLVAQVVIDSVPKYVEAGIALIMGLLRGIRDNIGEFVTVVSDIIENFLNAFSEQMPELVESVTNFLATAFTEVAYGLGELMPTLMYGVGISFIEGFWNGLKEQAGRLGELIMGIISDIIGWFTSGFGIHSPSTVMADIGKNIIQGLIDGVKGMFNLLKTVFVEIPGKVLSWIGNVLKLLWKKGSELIGGLLSGITTKILEVANFYKTLGSKILGWIGAFSSTLKQKGTDLIIGLWAGISERITQVREWFQTLPGRIVGWAGSMYRSLFSAGEDLIKGLWNGISAMKDWVMDKVKGFAGSIVDGVKGFFGIKSPSTVFMRIGKYLGEGLANGIRKIAPVAATAAVNMANNVHNAWNRANKDLSLSVANIDEFRPVITPVLDLTQVQSEAKNLNKMVSDATIAPVLSFANAQVIASARNNQNGSDSEVLPPTSVTNHFEQNNYSPEALSTADIYRQTKSQFALAREELEIA